MLQCRNQIQLALQTRTICDGLLFRSFARRSGPPLPTANALCWWPLTLRRVVSILRSFALDSPYPRVHLRPGFSVRVWGLFRVCCVRSYSWPGAARCLARSPDRCMILTYTRSRSVSFAIKNYALASISRFIAEPSCCFGFTGARPCLRLGSSVTW